MKNVSATQLVFDESSVWKILFRLAPPVMLAQLIQAMYIIVEQGKT